VVPDLALGRPTESILAPFAIGSLVPCALLRRFSLRGVELHETCGIPESVSICPDELSPKRFLQKARFASAAVHRGVLDGHDAESVLDALLLRFFRQQV
jgi:hypothetical protein